MKLTRIFSVILCLVLLASTLVACEKEPTLIEVEAKAAANLLKEPYLMTVSIDYSCDNEKMDPYFKQMSGMPVEMYMDGTDMEMSMDVMNMRMTYTLVDKTVYMNFMGQKLKMELDDEEYKEFINENAGGSAMELSVEDFANSEMTVDEDGNYVISCKSHNGGANPIIDKINESLKAMGDKVSVDSESFKYVVVVDSEYKLSKVSMNIKINMEAPSVGQMTVNVGYNIGIDYSKGKEINAPEDADKYTVMDGDSIFG